MSVINHDIVDLTVKNWFCKITITKRHPSESSPAISSSARDSNEYFETIFAPIDGIYSELNFLTQIMVNSRVKKGKAVCVITNDSESVKVMSPCSGVIYSKTFKTGDKVLEGYPLFLVQKKNTH